VTDILQPDLGPEVFTLYPREIREQIMAMTDFLSPEAEEANRKALREERIAAQKDYAFEQEEGRRQARAEREAAESAGEVGPDAEAFRDVRLRPRIAEAHAFEVQVRTPIVQGLFFKNSLTWVAGQSGTFKSFVTADLAFRYGQEDMDYHGRRMTHGRSLLVVAEGAAAYADRKVAWEKHHEREVKNVSIYPFPLQLGDTLKEMPALISYLREEAEAGRPVDLILFDTQAMCTVGVDENTSEMNLVINILHRIREVSGACVMIVHHFGKNKTAGMRGSSMIYAAADTVCVLKRPEDADHVSLSTAQADEGKQKDAITQKDLLTLDMVPHAVGKDYFEETVFSLVPVAADSGSHDVTDPVDNDFAEDLPWLTEPQMDHLKLASFYEHRGGSAADMAAKQAETTGPVRNHRQNIRNRMVELAKMSPPLVEQVGAKGPWRITPAGVAVIARQVAVGENWVERAGRKRAPKPGPGHDQMEVSGEVSKPAAKPGSET
jgi:hypothetical protein